jgi:hypothetical protein
MAEWLKAHAWKALKVKSLDPLQNQYYTRTAPIGEIVAREPFRNNNQHKN